MAAYFINVSSAMRRFRCTHCANPVYFENLVCLSCQSALGYLPSRADMQAFNLGGPDPLPMEWRPCANRHTASSCNWMLEGSEAGQLCQSCEFTEVIPDQSLPANQVAWRIAEEAKRRWLYTIRQLGLAVFPQSERYPGGLKFRILQSAAAKKPVMTGHINGIITINAAECDPVQRVLQRHNMQEPYRTVLGHFRHESGHFFWQILVEPYEQILQEFRAQFGDERADYSKSLKRHYRTGAPADWGAHFISAYAASHPWEDFAETWAHYMHMVDLVDAADGWGLTLANYPDADIARFAEAHGDADSKYVALLRRWMPLTLFANSLSRSLGHEDAYPFAPSPAVLMKMGWIHRLIKYAN